ncbi:hypothetical protein NHX12_026110 [Muraenolepis orangiensis]|uniref:WD repeat domain 21 n=1 Tax=Muraenolepis orangiensis TaxID=630683 RepID=A0A9Q0EFY6_9TELE|nr:hypothetical protein NHX12_026110 [Muraenolepis orangiensis]
MKHATANTAQVKPRLGYQHTPSDGRMPGDIYQPDSYDIYQPDSYDTYQPDSYDAYQPDRYAMKKWNWREEQRSQGAERRIEHGSSAAEKTFGASTWELLLQGDSASERVFTVNDVSHGGCKYGIMNFKGCSRGSLSVEMCDNLYFTNRKVNSICWASVNHPDSHVLLCLVGMADTPGCVSLLPASLFSNSNPAWSCAWCLNPQADKSFSTGLSRRVIVKDAETGRTQTYSVASDVLAQQFALRAPVLFNGCRSGEIFSIDLRQRSRRDHSWKSSRFHQGSAITSVRLLQDENYLLAADMLGQIKLWDVRVSKWVQEYKGHHNEHAYLPIHVNEAEGLLLAVGQDCYTRLWSLQDGQLLRTIPSPHPAANDLIPSVVFSSQLGGRRGLPGLLMAVKHDLYYFSYNTDPQESTGEAVH